MASSDASASTAGSQRSLFSTSWRCGDRTALQDAPFNPAGRSRLQKSVNRRSSPPVAIIRSVSCIARVSMPARGRQQAVRSTPRLLTIPRTSISKERSSTRKVAEDPKKGGRALGDLFIGYLEFYASSDAMSSLNHPAVKAGTFSAATRTLPASTGGLPEARPSLEVPVVTGSPHTGRKPPSSRRVAPGCVFSAPGTERGCGARPPG